MLVRISWIFWVVWMIELAGVMKPRSSPWNARIRPIENSPLRTRKTPSTRTTALAIDDTSSGTMPRPFSSFVNLCVPPITLAW
jgi:hypothetical protein